MSEGWRILTVVALVAVASFAATILLELRARRAKAAAAIALLGREPGADVPGALEGITQDSGEPVPAPLTGRPTLAFHIEVISRERNQVGGGEEIVTRRLFEEAGGAVRIEQGGAIVAEADLAGATSLLPVTDAWVLGATVFSSQTSAFARKALPPHQVAAYLANRGLPFPSQDSLFQAGLKITVNEWIVVPGQPIWVAGSASLETRDGGQRRAVFTSDAGPLYVGFGTLDDARRALQPKPLELLWTGFVVAMILSIVAGMITALIVPPVINWLSH